jgi:hypothetical protein
MVSIVCSSMKRRCASTSNRTARLTLTLGSSRSLDFFLNVQEPLTDDLIRTHLGTGRHGCILPTLQTAEFRCFSVLSVTARLLLSSCSSGELGGGQRALNLFTNSRRGSVAKSASPCGCVGDHLRGCGESSPGMAIFSLASRSAVIKDRAVLRSITPASYAAPTNTSSSRIASSAILNFRSARSVRAARTASITKAFLLMVLFLWVRPVLR